MIHSLKNLSKKQGIVSQISCCFSSQRVTLNKDPIVFDYAEIARRDIDLSERIREAYGPEGVGLCLVKNIPNYKKVRNDLLPLAYKLANLTDAQKAKITKPDFQYLVGWSHGVEKFKGKPDLSKGIYQGYPLDDKPMKVLDPQYKLYGGMIAENVWPTQDLPALEGAYKGLGKLMCDTGKLLAHHIDKYINAVEPTYKIGTLENDVIGDGYQHVSRLLHYYASNETSVSEEEDEWSGWHNDFGALTGLTSAMYIDRNGNTLDNFFDPTGGLFVKNRFAERQRLKIPQEYLAFQIGETAQILSGGAVEATPHGVIKGTKTNGTGISRNTFATFMQPNWNYVLKTPNQQNLNTREAYGVPPIRDRWEDGINFAQFGWNSWKYYT